MKLTQDQVKAAYDRLSSDPSSSIRKLAIELNVSYSALRERLKKYLGTQYDRLNPVQGSLAKLLQKDIIPSLRPLQKAEVTQWMNQNYELLTQDSGLLTLAQENRLTYLEVPHRHSLDDMIPLSEFLNDRLEKGFTYVPFNPETDETEVVTFCHNFLEDKSPPQLLTSYISLFDLEAVLADYFRGTLDNCDQYLDRLYKPLHELNPDNSLWGQVDSLMIEDCLNQLPLQERAALQFHFDHSLESETLLLKSFYQTATHTDFNIYIQTQYFNGLTHLIDHLIQIL